MRQTFVIPAVVAAFLAAVAFAAAPAGAAVAPSLQGETSLSANTGPIQGTCNPNGNSTLSFTAQGTAVGPYPGTYTETLMVTIGPQTQPPVNSYAFNTGPLLVAHATFMIDSPVGQVTGTKDLTLDIPGQGTAAGTCANATDADTTGTFQTFCDNIGGGSATDVSLQKANGSVTYDASIQSVDGSFRDSGLASFAFIVLNVRCANGDLENNGFNESFLLSNGVVPLTTPGHAEGGGQIDHVDGSPGVVFGFTAYSKDTGTIIGHCNVVDGDIHIRCLDATQYAQVGDHATFSGTADIDGSATTYRIDVQDNADPGVGTDTFSITTGSGYSATGVLTQGNIQIHS